MRRSALLATLVLLAFTGCLAPVSDSPTEPAPTPSATGTSSSTATPTPVTATPYPNETVEFPAGPKSRPDLPDAITAETAGAYAKRHEFRYSYNELWAGPGTEVGMSAENSCRVESTERKGSGYVVVVRCTAYVNEPVDGNGSTETRHYDYAPWTARYYVDGNSVLREELE